ncbi:MAG: DUF1499 domain-containing protein [Saccharofermentanales bacterium]
MSIFQILFNVILTIIEIIIAFALLSGIIIFVQNRNTHLILGLENGKLREIPNKKNSVSTDTAYTDKLVSPMPFKETLDETKAALKRALGEYGGIVIVKDENNYIYAIATTPLMRFHDDIEIHFDESSRTIRFRSASRAGYSDMGLNRQRYDKIVKLYEGSV